MTEKVTIALGSLTEGTRILSVTKLSQEYSLLDSRRTAVLKTRFKGAKVLRSTGGGTEEVPVESLSPGEAITAITAFPQGTALDAINGDMLEFFRSHGFLEFEGIPAWALEDGNGGGKPQTREIPVFASMKNLEHKKRVAEARFFIEQVEKAEKARVQTTDVMKDLFRQGRADATYAKAAAEMMNSIRRIRITGAMAAVSGLMACDKVYGHSVDMAVLFHEASMGILKATGKGENDKMAQSTLVAGYLHDIGQSKLPQELLESEAVFGPGSEEIRLIRGHVDTGAQILSDAGMDDTMINIVRFHHVKKDTTSRLSYPDVSYEQVKPLTRLASIVDTYQALTGKREYKPHMVPAKAVEFISETCKAEFDESMLARFLQVVGKYPVGSLVRISTGDLGFVTKVEGQPVDRPIVALVENNIGEAFTQNPLVSLADEPDLSVTEWVDHYDYYNESLDQAFKAFKSLNVI